LLGRFAKEDGPTEPEAIDAMTSPGTAAAGEVDKHTIRPEGAPAAEKGASWWRRVLSWIFSFVKGCHAVTSYLCERLTTITKDVLFKLGSAMLGKDKMNTMFYEHGVIMKVTKYQRRMSDAGMKDLAASMKAATKAYKDKKLEKSNKVGTAVNALTLTEHMHSVFEAAKLTSKVVTVIMLRDKNPEMRAEMMKSADIHLEEARKINLCPISLINEQEADLMEMIARCRKLIDIARARVTKRLLKAEHKIDEAVGAKSGVKQEKGDDDDESPIDIEESVETIEAMKKLAKSTNEPLSLLRRAGIPLSETGYIAMCMVVSPIVVALLYLRSRMTFEKTVLADFNNSDETNVKFAMQRERVCSALVGLKADSLAVSEESLMDIAYYGLDKASAPSAAEKSVFRTVREAITSTKITYDTLGTSSDLSKLGDLGRNNQKLDALTLAFMGTSTEMGNLIKEFTYEAPMTRLHPIHGWKSVWYTNIQNNPSLFRTFGDFRRLKTAVEADASVRIDALGIIGVGGKEKGLLGSMDARDLRMTDSVIKSIGTAFLFVGIGKAFFSRKWAEGALMTIAGIAAWWTMPGMIAGAHVIDRFCKWMDGLVKRGMWMGALSITSVGIVTIAIKSLPGLIAAL
jgi:hypothetical protein